MLEVDFWDQQRLGLNGRLLSVVKNVTRNIDIVTLFELSSRLPIVKKLLRELCALRIAFSKFYS